MFKNPGIMPAKYQRTHFTSAFKQQREQQKEAPTSIPDSLFMTETGCLRFARDYGIVPYLITKSELRDLYQKANHAKCFVSSRLPAREQIFNKMPHSIAQKSKVIKKKE